MKQASQTSTDIAANVMLKWTPENGDYCIICNILYHREKLHTAPSSFPRAEWHVSRKQQELTNSFKNPDKYLLFVIWI